MKEFREWLQKQPKKEFTFEKGEEPTKEYVFRNVMEHIKNEIVFVEGDIHLWELENTVKVKIVKRDEKGDPIANITYQIMNEKKEVVDTIVTNIAGIARSKVLPYGKYFYRETEAPANVIIDATEHEFITAKEKLALPEFVIEMEEDQALIHIAPSKEYQYGYIVSVFSKKRLKLREDGVFPHSDQITYDMMNEGVKWEDLLEAYQKNKKEFSLSLENEFQLYTFMFELIAEITRVNQKL